MKHSSQNIRIFGAKEVFVCDEDFQILQNGGIAFEEGKDTILCVDTFKNLCEQFPDAKTHFSHQGILLPALINPHIHFEFGGHIARFSYGDFGAWLDSLMEHRDSILGDLKDIIQEGINEQILCGVGSVGAISSYGDDKEILAQSPLRVVYFNEAIGSNPASVDFLYQNFLQRFEDSRKLKSSTFIPAIALHSPYSLHSIMAKHLIALATKECAPLSAHFLESHYEREWLETSSGYFRGFFQRLASLKDPTSFYTPLSFLEMLSPLSDKSPILLTHCLHTSLKELAQIAQLNATIVMCPRSNRLLSNRYFDIKSSLTHHIPVAIGTDGKSSNFNVNLLDELRFALFAYPQMDLLDLAKMLILGVTSRAAKALGLQNGTLQTGKNVDFALFDFPESLNQSPLSFILHAKKPQILYVNAKCVYESR
uniref:Chlorohydrolase n=1 Tax=uncultured Helicobacter sp. TaxID=175537 RepID=A0A650EKU6_9HELI|nr:chlorohydrolase [uncultured Helicobacter sp.]